MKKQMRKDKKYRCELITFDEFIDCITDNKGEEIKRKINSIELNSQRKNNQISIQNKKQLGVK